MTEKIVDKEYYEMLWGDPNEPERNCTDRDFFDYIHSKKEEAAQEMTEPK